MAGRRASSQRGLLAPLADVLTPRSLPVTIGEVQQAAAGADAGVKWRAREWVRLERKRLRELERYTERMARCMADPEFYARVHGRPADG